MPAYDYRCERGHRYERRQPFGSPRTHDCEQCGSPAHRVLTAPAIAFKGSGWYKTDSRGAEPRGGDDDRKSKSGSGSASSGASTSDSGSSNGSSPDAGKGDKSSGKGSKGSKGKAKQTDTAKAD